MSINLNYLGPASQTTYCPPTKLRTLLHAYSYIFNWHIRDPTAGSGLSNNAIDGYILGFGTRHV